MLSSTIDIGTIRANWRQLTLSPFTWRKSPNQAGAIGESGGIYVEAKGFDRRAYLKPAKELSDDLHHCRAAREKIASDLAYDLGLPVPPACLWSYELRPVVVSLVMYPRQWPWRIVNAYEMSGDPLGALAFAKILAGCSAMYVFDTWVQQSDHGDHPHNIVWGYVPLHISDSAIIFLDYANSLGYDSSWDSDGWKTIEKAAFPVKMCDHLNVDRVSSCIEDIENFPNSAIQEIIERIPDRFLPVEQKATIYKGLAGRKTLLHTTFSDLLPTS